MLYGRQNKAGTDHLKIIKLVYFSELQVINSFCVYVWRCCIFAVQKTKLKPDQTSGIFHILEFKAETLLCLEPVKLFFFFSPCWIPASPPPERLIPWRCRDICHLWNTEVLISCQSRENDGKRWIFCWHKYTNTLKTVKGSGKVSSL